MGSLWGSDKVILATPLRAMMFLAQPTRFVSVQTKKLNPKNCQWWYIALLNEQNNIVARN